MKNIVIKNAREHNLQNISLEIPKNKLVVITGLSGSGKSSLAFDTLYAEGQRRYVESLSAYARQFLGLMKKPDVDFIEGLSPAISIEQKTTSHNPRSTVGTVTEIYDYLRLMYARVGVPYSPTTGKPIKALSISGMADTVMHDFHNQRVYLIAPVVRRRKGLFETLFENMRRKGFTRFIVDNELCDIDTLPILKKDVKHTIEVIIDRLRIKPESRQRVVESVELVIDLSEGILCIYNPEEKNRILLSNKYTCPESGFSIPSIEPRLFSFNSPVGACPICDGLGIEVFMDPDLIIPDQNKPLLTAIMPWTSAHGFSYRTMLETLALSEKIKLHTLWKDLPESFKQIVLYGSSQPLRFEFTSGKMSHSVKRPFEGVIPNLNRRFQETQSHLIREELHKFQTSKLCRKCHGTRLRPEALAVKVNEKNIAEITAFSIKKLQMWIQQTEVALTGNDLTIAKPVFKELQTRLQFLLNVGLDYITLNRTAGTLSGGEAQRIRLASQIGSGLNGVMYVLDEPSIGLHQRDNQRLIHTLQHLRDLDNSVIVVEHDEEMMRTADHLIDIGLGAGKHGGNIIYNGVPEKINESPDSLTGQYLSGKKKIPLPKKRYQAQNFLRLIEASGNNLKNITVDIPIGCFTCVTGVSGSGKSTLILQTLWPAMAGMIMRARTHPEPYKRIEGTHHFDKVIDINQSPIGRTPRSNPATYTGIFTYIRDWYAALPESKARGYTAGRFSFNVPGGRCEHCKGDGTIKIEMHFLPDVYVTCEQCNGKRYNPETLEITYQDKNIADVLNMTVNEASKFFENFKNIQDKLQTLIDVGLGYIHLGQSATTLSGGEAQRIKLSKELSRRSTGKTIYFLDEPTTGLHFDDIKKLIQIIYYLRNQGNTVVVIEHNLDVIKTADWIIDMGPDGGDNGGACIAIGKPETVAQNPQSVTGQFLKPLLSL